MTKYIALRKFCKVLVVRMTCKCIHTFLVYRESCKASGVTAVRRVVEWTGVLLRASAPKHTALLPCSAMVWRSDVTRCASALWSRAWMLLPIPSLLPSHTGDGARRHRRQGRKFLASWWSAVRRQLPPYQFLAPCL